MISLTHTMASNNYVQTLIAHYLSTNYPSALPSYLSATNLHVDLSRPPDVDLRTIIHDYLSASLSSRMEDVELVQVQKDDLGSGWNGWTAKDVVGLKLGPGVKLGGVMRSFEGVSAANLLTVKVAGVPYRSFDTASAEYKSRHDLNIITSSVDKTIKFVDYSTGEVERILEPHRAAILCFDLHPRNPRYLVTGSMDGTTMLTDLITLEPLQTFKSNKFVVRLAFSPDGTYLATASYDRDIVIYRASSPHSSTADMSDDGDDDMVLDSEDHPQLASDPTLRYEEVHKIKCDSNPEAILFHPQSTWLMYTLRSSHTMYYLRLPSVSPSPGTDPVATHNGDGGDWQTLTKSFNPHPMDTHISFSVLNLALHPSGKVVACQTGDHRGGSGERILLYGIEPDETDRLGCIWTGTDGDDFVLPRMAWLPDGTALITTSPNGYLNLLTLDGTTRSSIKVHGGLTELGQASSEVVRDIAVVGDEQHGWAAVSVGYDRQIRITR